MCRDAWWGLVTLGDTVTPSVRTGGQLWTLRVLGGEVAMRGSGRCPLLLGARRWPRFLPGA